MYYGKSIEGEKAGQRSRPVPGAVFQLPVGYLLVPVRNDINFCATPDGHPSEGGCMNE